MYCTYKHSHGQRHRDSSYQKNDDSRYECNSMDYFQKNCSQVRSNNFKKDGHMVAACDRPNQCRTYDRKYPAESECPFKSRKDCSIEKTVQIVSNQGTS